MLSPTQFYDRPTASGHHATCMHLVFWLVVCAASGYVYWTFSVVPIMLGLLPLALQSLIGIMDPGTSFAIFTYFNMNLFIVSLVFLDVVIAAGLSLVLLSCVLIAPDPHCSQAFILGICVKASLSSLWVLARRRLESLRQHGWSHQLRTLVNSAAALDDVIDHFNRKVHLP